VIVPLLSHLLGQSNPITVLRRLWLGAWAFTLLFSAACSRSLCGSKWAALLTPPTLLVCIRSFGFGDIYWVTAWATVTFLPLLVLLARSKPRWLRGALVAIGLVAGVVSAIRSDAGLAVALAAAAVAAGRRRSLRTIVPVAVLSGYLAPAQIVLPAIRAQRDRRVGVNLSATAPASHPRWHTLYIGLGYTPSRDEIHYPNSYGAVAAQELDPQVRYLSPAYASVLRKQVQALPDHDPGFVAKAEAQRALGELSHAGRYLLQLALLLPATLTARGGARLRPWELALFASALAIGAVQAIVAVPFRDYELGLLGPLGLLAIGSGGQCNGRVPEAGA
jgi:hypothetical protein